MIGVSGAHLFHRIPHNVSLIPRTIRSNYSKVEFAWAGPMQAQFARAHPLVDDSGVVDDYARAKIGTHAVGDDEDDDEDDE